MPKPLDFWFEFASTYSYPAALRIEDMARHHGVQIRWRPFLLGAVFKALGQPVVPFNEFPRKGAYMWRDLERICVAHALPMMRAPEPFPMPSIHAARVAVALEGEACLPDFVRAVYLAEFHQRQNIAEEAVLAHILQSVGIEPEPVFAKAKTDEIKQNLRAETEAAYQAGLFGAPSFVTSDGEIFWGHDRMQDAVLWQKKVNEHG